MSNTPLGPNTEVYTSGREYLWSRVTGTYMKKTIILDASARDQGYTLRKGLALGKITALGTYAAYVSGNSNGTQVFKGFLDEECDLLDQYGNPQQRPATMVVWGRVKTANTFFSGVSPSVPITGLDGSTGCFFIWD